MEHLKKNLVKMKIRTHEYEKERMFALVLVHEYNPIERAYHEEGLFWADAVTGTLYDPKTGDCLTSYYMKLLVNEGKKNGNLR